VLEQLTWLGGAQESKEEALSSGGPCLNGASGQSKARIPSARPGVVVNRILYLAYGSEEQGDRLRKRKTGLVVAVCEHCRARLEPLDLFYWRLFGLCLGCHVRAERVCVPGVVVTEASDGGLFLGGIGLAEDKVFAGPRAWVRSRESGI
jgi:hypothetical protein